MRGFKNFKGSDARCPSIHFLFYDVSSSELLELLNRKNFENRFKLNKLTDVQHP